MKRSLEGLFFRDIWQYREGEGPIDRKSIGRKQSALYFGEPG
jgi:hypothetical protein